MRQPPLLLLLFAVACAPSGVRAPTPASPSFEALARWDSVAAHAISDGVTHLSAWNAAGPWAVQIVEIDLTRCQPALRARKPGPPLSERATTSALGGDDLAAINADFFLLPAGTPVGAHVENGQVLAGPALRPAFIVVTPTAFSAGSAALHGFAVHHADSAMVAQVNRPIAGDAQHPARDGIYLYTHWHAEPVPSNALRLTRIAGDRFIVGASTPSSPDSAGIALAGSGTRAIDWLRRRRDGDTVVVSVRVLDEAGRAAVEAVGGFPLLVRAGRDVLAEQTGIIESFGPRRHPRTAIGWDDARLLFVVVDGRQPPWSDGMTLAELAQLFMELGVTDAINLDGGGSTAMLVRGQLVNRPSDVEGERAVGNALSLIRCE